MHAGTMLCALHRSTHWRSDEARWSGRWKHAAQLALGEAVAPSGHAGGEGGVMPIPQRVGTQRSRLRSHYRSVPHLPLKRFLTACTQHLEDLQINQGKTRKPVDTTYERQYPERTQEQERRGDGPDRQANTEKSDQLSAGTQAWAGT